MKPPHKPYIFHSKTYFLIKRDDLQTVGLREVFQSGVPHSTLVSTETKPTWTNTGYGFKMVTLTDFQLFGFEIIGEI